MSKSKKQSPENLVMGEHGNRRLGELSQDEQTKALIKELKAGGEESKEAAAIVLDNKIDAKRVNNIKAAKEGGASRQRNSQTFDADLLAFVKTKLKIPYFYTGPQDKKKILDALKSERISWFKDAEGSEIRSLDEVGKRKLPKIIRSAIAELKNSQAK